MENRKESLQTARSGGGSGQWLRVEVAHDLLSEAGASVDSV